jgi:hypothetical protein
MRISHAERVTFRDNLYYGTKGYGQALAGFTPTIGTLLPNNPFHTTTGSPIVLVDWPGHPFVPGRPQNVRFTGATATGGLTLVGPYVATYVNANQFNIGENAGLPVPPATSTNGAGGGGSAVIAYPYTGAFIDLTWEDIHYLRCGTDALDLKNTADANKGLSLTDIFVKDSNSYNDTGTNADHAGLDFRAENVRVRNYQYQGGFPCTGIRSRRTVGFHQGGFILDGFHIDLGRLADTRGVDVGDIDGVVSNGRVVGGRVGVNDAGFGVVFQTGATNGRCSNVHAEDNGFNFRARNHLVKFVSCTEGSFINGPASLDTGSKINSVLCSWSTPVVSASHLTISTSADKTGDNTPFTLIHDTDSYDPYFIHSTANGDTIIPVGGGGTYEISLAVWLTGIGELNHNRFMLEVPIDLVTGTDFSLRFESEDMKPDVNGRVTLSLPSAVVNLAAGDIIRSPIITVFGTGKTVGVVAGMFRQTYLNVKRLSP